MKRRAVTSSYQFSGRVVPSRNHMRVAFNVAMQKSAGLVALKMLADRTLNKDADGRYSHDLDPYLDELAGIINRVLRKDGSQ